MVAPCELAREVPRRPRGARARGGPCGELERCPGGTAEGCARAPREGWTAQPWPDRTGVRFESTTRSEQVFERVVGVLSDPTADHPVPCSHVACAWAPGCQYVPEVPAIGPELPVQIRDANGQLWTRDTHGAGRIYWTAQHELVTWSVVVGHYRSKRDTWPGGSWTVVGVSHDDGWGWGPL